MLLTVFILRSDGKPLTVGRGNTEMGYFCYFFTVKTGTFTNLDVQVQGKIITEKATCVVPNFPLKRLYFLLKKSTTDDIKISAYHNYIIIQICLQIKTRAYPLLQSCQ